MKNVCVYSLCVEDTNDKMVQMTPMALLEEVEGSAFHTTPICDNIAEYEPKWS